MTASTASGGRPAAWHRLAVALRPRRTRAQAAIAVLFVLLGLGAALQVRSNAQFDGLSTAREADLVGILDDLTARNERGVGPGIVVTVTDAQGKVDAGTMLDVVE